MSDRDSPVTEEELHAYVDGELPADRADAVVAWLAAHPEHAAQVADWRTQAESIRGRYGAVVNEPVPNRLKVDQIMRQTRSSGRSWAALTAAAAVVALVIGGGAGWVARGATIPATNGLEAFTTDAIEAYKLYVVEVRHPVEVPGDERAHMTQWLSKRLGQSLQIPDLQSIGLKLIGGRLLPGPSGAAAFYMYEGPSGERFTVYCAKTTTPESAIRYQSGNSAAASYWVDDKIAYVVSGPADRSRLEKVTKSVYEQVDRAAARKS